MIRTTLKYEKHWFRLDWSESRSSVCNQEAKVTLHSWYKSASKGNYRNSGDFYCWVKTSNLALKTFCCGSSAFLKPSLIWNCLTFSPTLARTDLTEMLKNHNHDCNAWASWSKIGLPWITIRTSLPISALPRATPDCLAEGPRNKPAVFWGTIPLHSYEARPFGGV